MWLTKKSSRAFLIATYDILPMHLCLLASQIQGDLYKLLSLQSINWDYKVVAVHVPYSTLI